MTASFERFVGIDWSGAEGQGQSGIRVAELSRENTLLKLIEPQQGNHWSRREVLEFVSSLVDRPTLVGLDFAFSLPWIFGPDSWPASLAKLRGARDLWAFVDEFCKAEPFLYAGPVWLSEMSPFLPFIKFWSRGKHHEGDLFEGGRLRRTEVTARQCGVQAKSVFRMVGPQVGAGSFAGMRFLHLLAQRGSIGTAIWPFDAIENANVVVTEIYPAIFYRKAGQRRPSRRQFKSGDHAGVFQDVLHFFEIESKVEIPKSDDQMDALVSAAALSRLSRSVSSFVAPADPVISLREGWIFGVPIGARA